MRRYYAGLPTFDAFERVVDPAVFAALPADAVIAISDVVGSTRAIAEGRYKAVNMAGAALISAVMNALGHRDFPFVFGGDGASFAIDAGDVAIVRATMADTAAWVRDELGLEMRIAMVPLADIRQQGLDVRVARYAASPEASYAMFSGGGVAWAEARMKRGEFTIAAAGKDARPDLTGLSCRWEPLRSRNGVMLSLLVQAASSSSPERFAELVRLVLAEIDGSATDHGHPVRADGLAYRWPPSGLDFEARATRGNGSLHLRRAVLAAKTVLATILFRTGWRVGGFDPAHYLEQSVLNTDYRKFDDGLRMTIDCAVDTADRLQGLLDAAERDGIAHYGMYRQTEALMTCIVPSAVADDHLHFVDGAGGGYATAAAQLKSKLAVGASA